MSLCSADIATARGLCFCVARTKTDFKLMVVLCSFRRKQCTRFDSVISTKKERKKCFCFGKHDVEQLESFQRSKNIYNFFCLIIYQTYPEASLKSYFFPSLLVYLHEAVHSVDPFALKKTQNKTIKNNVKLNMHMWLHITRATLQEHRCHTLHAGTNSVLVALRKERGNILGTLSKLGWRRQ